MVATINTSARMEAQTKQESEARYKEPGLNMNTAINMFVKQAISENRIPFHDRQSQTQCRFARSVPRSRRVLCKRA